MTMIMRQQQQQQKYARGRGSPDRRVTPAPATLADVDSGMLSHAEAASLAAAACEAAREAAHWREAAIRAVGLDGIVLGGATIRRMRRAARLSSDALATMIGYSGALVRAWETGRRRCPPRIYLPLIEALAHAHRDRQEQTVPVTRARHAHCGTGHCAA
jgi:DNA-binding transcriptional regulator YiaG